MAFYFFLIYIGIAIFLFLFICHFLVFKLLERRSKSKQNPYIYHSNSEPKAANKKTESDKGKKTPYTSSSTSVPEIAVGDSRTPQPSYKESDVSGTELARQPVELLEWAIQSDQKVQFNYENSQGENKNFTVTPLGFNIIEQTPCLQGYCHLRKAKKSFAIERIRNVRIVSPDKKSNHLQVSPQKNVTLTSDKSKSPQQNSAQSVRTKSQNLKRPYIKYLSKDLERLADAQWSNVEVLSEIHKELEFRSRKKARVLREHIAQRLKQLQDLQFVWPTTTVTPGSDDGSPETEVSSPETGLLSQCGYKVGMNGLPESQRRQILDTIFIHSLSFVNDTNYLKEWGEPNTEKRLKKLANCIAAFTRNAKRRNPDSYNKAIQDWEADLAYLKRTYYDGHFQWPRTGKS